MSYSKSVNVCLNISDRLTSISCGHIVVEIIKFLIYQRLQIPYTYQWLKQIVNKRKSRIPVAKESLQSERHFRTVSSSLDNLDFILKSLLQEISGATMPQEVCITMGATPVTCKEVYRLILPNICHRPQCQSSSILKDQKLQSHVFRTLVTSETLMQAFSNPLGPTSMHVFIKKKVSNHSDILNPDNFLPASGSRIPKSCKMFVIDFRNPVGENFCSCNQFEIFGDVVCDDLANMMLEETKSDDGVFEIQSTSSLKWYQSTYTMKGFKDCVVDGQSITNLWL